MDKKTIEAYIEAKAKEHSRYPNSGVFSSEAEESAKHGAHLLLPPLLTALTALEFYASAQPSDTMDKPFFRNEFGCKCCAGTNDANGDNDFDKNVVGLTAREALAEVNQMLTPAGQEGQSISDGGSE